MEHQFHFHGGGEQMGIPTWLVFTLLITSCFFSHLSSSASDFTPTTSLLLNCGSGDNATAPNDPRSFLPDSVYVSPSASNVFVADPNPSPGTASLYRTARAFTKRSSYEFTVRTTGAHVLRLHFFPFWTAPDGYDLFSAVFTVTALQSFLLLSNFSVARGAALPVVKEYILWVNDSAKLDVTFAPSAGGSSQALAFVSAIEVFTVPKELFPSSERFAGLSPRVGLETVHRINMGGPLLFPSNDTLWRKWTPDDGYLFGKETAVEVSTTSPIQYQNDGTGSTREVAPDRVYSTARAMNARYLPDPRFNITWQFNVSRGGSHQVRMHFYDMVSTAAAELYFNAYVDGQVVYEDLQPSTYTFKSYSVPFYWDSVVNDSRGGGGGGAGGWRVMSVSVGRSAKSVPKAVNATLNGLEIMRILNGGDEGSRKKKKRSLGILIPSVLGGLALLALVISCPLHMSARRRQRRHRLLAGRPPPERKKMMAESCSPLPGHGLLGKSVTTVVNLGLRITFKEIRFATNDFDEGLVIGSGGFGKVYRGLLRDGTRVAVKRGTPGSGQGYPEFQREVVVLSVIRHRHLVSLIGYCEERGQMILVYEFMEKGTLRGFLYGDDAAPCLSWKQRLEVCIGAARGIRYLHTGCSQGIIHRDLKSSNILLGDGYVAKVADFGLSRLGPSPGETHVSTDVKGSFGYFDPEYFKTQQLTEKSDVYSFGVVLFEVLCARPALDPKLSGEQINLAEWAASAQRLGRLEEIVDPRIRGAISPGSLRRFAETAMKCLAEYGSDRPAMADVLWSLEYCLQLQEMELRRDPHEDSGAVPVPVVVRRLPSGVHVSGDVGADGGAPPGVDEAQMDSATNSKVFSQLFTHEGR